MRHLKFCYWEKKQSIKTSYIFQDIIENTTKTHYTKSPNVPCNEIIACFFFFLNLHDCDQKGFLSLVFVLEFFDFVRQKKFSLFMYVLKGIFWYISRHFPAVFFWQISTDLLSPFQKIVCPFQKIVCVFKRWFWQVMIMEGKNDNVIL